MQDVVRRAAESERVRDLERQLKLEQDRFRELRHQVESAEGGTVIKDATGGDGNHAYAVIEDPVGVNLALVPG